MSKVVEGKSTICPSMKKIPWSDIDIVGRIAVSGDCVIYQARQLSEGRMVAIKTMADKYAMYAEDIVIEAELISMVNHPNVISLYGLTEFPTTHHGDIPAMVIEYMPDGNLRQALLNKPDRLPWRSRVVIAAQVADAMQHMYAKRIAHGDVNPTNWLLDLADQARPVCKLADFDRSGKEVDDEDAYKEDVAVFGFVSWNLLIGQNTKDWDEVRSGLSDYRPPQMQEGCDHFRVWKKLIQDCVMEEAVDRPNPNEVAARMRNLLDAMSDSVTDEN